MSKRTQLILEAMKVLSVVDVFQRPYRRTRMPVDIESFNQFRDVEPYYVWGLFTPAGFTVGPTTVTMTIKGGVNHLSGVLVEFECPRCHQHHERPAVLGDKRNVISEGAPAYEQATILLSAMESRCDPCLAEVKALENEIQIAHERIHALQQAIRLLEDQIHDKRLLVAKSECRTKDCETCDRRRAMEAQERGEYNDDDDEDEEESDY